MFERKNRLGLNGSAVGSSLATGRFHSFSERRKPDLRHFAHACRVRVDAVGKQMVLTYMAVHGNKPNTWTAEAWLLEDFLHTLVIGADQRPVLARIPLQAEWLPQDTRSGCP
jgi:hypothetical protein